ncbi:maleylpyruvate isomerase family mycothiol-dependent enzyme [Mycobacterium vicinigordonae]|uniref:Maleylpyruvate isomerase family mycothiol-dependent enzyme n=1 Tax=Mycobacterium vicinigordonae TaxID=1719132 RepID=A0A7D6E1H8_9MYCO|nr:maleylpyruvate isomerase family mycothiol-dependent enzyme [Mycobacterium vicinigordonae]QLL05242.1 maleylpyruvate isomerase family mycothiol-dependent enzyme [Mycobacterium vicinigordonae]
MYARLGEFHLAVCRRFSSAVQAAEGKWERATPCPDWDARAIVEHVIGFHDVLLLRPLGLKPERPRDDPRKRWQLTYERLELALGPIAALDERSDLLPRLTQDVLIHAWDLARAVGADDVLDPGWCRHFLDHPPADAAALSASGMFGPLVVVDPGSNPQSQLLARLGRDPR